MHLTAGQIAGEPIGLLSAKLGHSVSLLPVFTPKREQHKGASVSLCVLRVIVVNIMRADGRGAAMR